MSLITLPAFLRRREDAPVPETTTEPVVDEANAVVMQFRTRGGATVELSKSYRTTFWVQSSPTGRETIYPYRCLGCDHEFDNYTSVYPARDEANKHAEACWSTPKPQGT